MRGNQPYFHTPENDDEQCHGAPKIYVWVWKADRIGVLAVAMETGLGKSVWLYVFSAHIVYIWPALSHGYLSLFNELEVLLFFSAFPLDVNSSVWPQLIFWFQLTRSLFSLDRTNGYPFHSNKGPHVWSHNSALCQHVWNESIVSSSGLCEPGVCFILRICLGHMEM